MILIRSRQIGLKLRRMAIFLKIKLFFQVSLKFFYSLYDDVQGIWKISR
eukprot:UN28306